MWNTVKKHSCLLGSTNSLYLWEWLKAFAALQSKFERKWVYNFDLKLLSMKNDGEVD